MLSYLRVTMHVEMPDNPGTAVLLERIAELEHNVQRQRERVYVARRSRDRWKARALALEPDARNHRRWLAHLSRITRTP